MTELRVRPEAELDIFEAALWYEQERDELGTVFLRSFRRVLARIEASPYQFHWSQQTFAARSSRDFPSGSSSSSMPTRSS